MACLLTVVVVVAVVIRNRIREHKRFFVDNNSCAFGGRSSVGNGHFNFFIGGSVQLIQT